MPHRRSSSAAGATVAAGGGGWGNGWGGMGPGEISQSIAQRGFRIIAPLRRNGNVFVADVVDRRGRRERLIVASGDAEILQRSFLDDPGLPGFVPRRAMAPRRISSSLRSAPTGAT